MIIVCIMYINMKFDEIHLRGLKFSTTVNDNDNIINIQKYHYIRAVYLISYIQRGSATDTAFHRTERRSVERTYLSLI